MQSLSLLMGISLVDFKGPFFGSVLQESQMQAKIAIDTAGARDVLTLVSTSQISEKGSVKGVERFTLQ